MSHARKPLEELPIDKEKIKKAFDVSHFDINAVLRGVQLTLVGGRTAPTRQSTLPRA